MQKVDSRDYWRGVVDALKEARVRLADMQGSSNLISAKMVDYMLVKFINENVNGKDNDNYKNTTNIKITKQD